MSSKYKFHNDLFERGWVTVTEHIQNLFREHELNENSLNLAQASRGCCTTH
jgi:hypothetical protein